MHGLTAAGRALECNCGEDGITRMVAHVVDPVAVLKVKNRVYNGFSIGGRVVEREAGNNRNITRLALHEISLVDRPANPQATIDLWKLGESSMPDGLGVMQTAFAEAMAKTQQVWRCNDSTHTHTKKEDAAGCMAKAGQSTTKTGLPNTPPIKPGEPPGAPNSEGNFDGDGDSDDNSESAESAGGGFSPESEANRHADFAGKKGDGDGPSKPYGDVTYADPGYRNNKKRYPIDSEDHVRAAWSYINMPKNAKKYSSEQLSSIKAKIRAAAKKHGVEIAAKVADVGDESEIAHMAAELVRVVEMLGDLTVEKAGRRQSAADHFLMNVAHDAIGKLGEGQWCAKAGGNATQDTGGNATHPAPSASPPAESFTPGSNATQDTSKRGSRHSSATLTHLKAAHDSMCKAGAMCPVHGNMGKTSTTEDSAMSAAESLFSTTLTGEPDEVAKALKKALKKNDKMEKQMGEMAHQMQTMQLHVEHMAKQSGTPPPPAPAPVEKEGKLKKQLGTMAEMMQAMQEKIEQIAKQPMPGIASHLPPGIIDVSKAQDGRQAPPPPEQTQAAEEIAKRWESMTPDERFAASYAVSRLRPYTQQR
jgi:hypothetical protein